MREAFHPKEAKLFFRRFFFKKSVKNIHEGKHILQNEKVPYEPTGKTVACVHTIINILKKSYLRLV